MQTRPVTPRRTPAPYPERGVTGTPDTDRSSLPRERPSVLPGQKPIGAAIDRVTGPDRGAGSTAPPRQEPGGSRNRLSPRNWRVRSRLTVLVLVPLLATVTLAATRIAQQVDTVRVYDHAHFLVLAAEPLNQLIDSLELERDLTVQFVAERGFTAQNETSPYAATDKRLLLVNGQVQQQQTLTGHLADALAPSLINIDGSYPIAIRNAIADAQSEYGTVPSLRAASRLNSSLPEGMFNGYNRVIQSFIHVEAFVSTGTSDQGFINNVTVLSKITDLTETESQLRGYSVLVQAQNPNPTVGLDVGVIAAASTELATLQATITKDKTDFESLAAPAMLQIYSDTVTGPDVAKAETTIYQLGKRFSGAVMTNNITSDISMQQVTAVVDANRTVRGKQVQVLIDESSQLADNARRSMYVNIGVIVGIVALATIGTLLIARSLTGPLRILQATALEIAGNRLPELVRRLRDADGAEIIEPIVPIALTTTDEVGQVARAFDEVHREAVRLATEQAMLRSNVNSMFVNLSRRSQSLVQRQLRLIDELENSEQDPDQLSSLFKLDHLATRMRRNGENLLVLAGEEPGRRWSQPVPLLDVVRAAASEVEQYERVTLRDLPVVEAAGRTVNDLVHLVAELLENATSFSAPETKVTVTGNLLNTGGVMLEIEDSGIGMTPEELDDANERLANPPVVDVAISRRMGLFVVGRLATRHGIQVRLRRSATGGITALVLVPAALLAGNALASSLQGEMSDTGQQPALTSTGLPRRPGATRQEVPRALPPGSSDRLPSDEPGTEAESGAGDGWEDLSTSAASFRGSTPPGLAELLAETDAMTTGTIPVVRDEIPGTDTPMFAGPGPDGLGGSLGSPLGSTASYEQSPFSAGPPFAGDSPFAEPPPFDTDFPFGEQSPFRDQPAPDGLDGTGSFQRPGFDTGAFDRPTFDTGTFDRPTFDPMTGSEELDGPLADSLNGTGAYDFRDMSPGASASDSTPGSDDHSGEFRISAGSGDMTLNFRVPGTTPPGSPAIPPTAPQQAATASLAPPPPVGRPLDFTRPERPVAPADATDYDYAQPPAQSFDRSFDDLLPNIGGGSGDYAEYSESNEGFEDRDGIDDLLMPESTLTGLSSSDSMASSPGSSPVAEYAPAAPAQAAELMDPLSAPLESLPLDTTQENSPLFNAINSEWFRVRAGEQPVGTPALELGPGSEQAAEQSRPSVPGPRVEARSQPSVLADVVSSATAPAAATFTGQATDSAAPQAPQAPPQEMGSMNIGESTGGSPLGGSGGLGSQGGLGSPLGSPLGGSGTPPRDSTRTGGSPAGGSDAPSAGGPGAAWQSPGDAGWRAAEAAKKPVAAGLTPKGLPKRVPRTNLVPGSADGTGAAKASAPPIPERSAEAVRSRLASFHQGLRQGRDAAADPSAASDPNSQAPTPEPGKQDAP